ncbi:MAG TPA: sigma-70 family RNA polymerase sigma factor, partial [Verrucomicrobiae bacterium]|nr:sigma-70 family RNA polymerase sigma factor [Verrucomicrobiae bacterium]
YLSPLSPSAPAGLEVPATGPTTAAAGMDSNDDALIAAVLAGDTASFEPLVVKYSPRLFATARRYARRDSEVEDVVQEVWCKAFQKLATYRGDAPFEHWLMRLAIRTCYDFLRAHQRNREANFSELTDSEGDWLDRFVLDPDASHEDSIAARQLVERILEMLSPAGRLIITLLEIEDRSVREISQLTGWSVPLVKVRAFRARAEMRKCLKRIACDKYL